MALDRCLISSATSLHSACTLRVFPFNLYAIALASSATLSLRGLISCRYMSISSIVSHSARARGQSEGADITTGKTCTRNCRSCSAKASFLEYENPTSASNCHCSVVILSIVLVRFSPSRISVGRAYLGSNMPYSMWKMFPPPQAGLA